MGVKYPKPVNIINKIDVLIGVRVTPELIAAMQLIMAKG